MRSMARFSSRSSVSRAITSRCKAAAARASASRNAGSLLQQAPALLGLGLDDLTDAALVHQRGRARAGRSIGEQDLHVAGAHLAAVDAVGRAVLALDPARHVERLVLVELGRRLALA